MPLTRKDLLWVAFALTAFAAASAAALQFQAHHALLISTAVCFLLLTLTILGCYRGLVRAIRYYAEKELAAGHKQLEEMILLTSAITPAVPFPPMHGFAIRPDFGNILAREIMRKKPRLIVELGSGVSTLICAYCLKRLGQGNVVSIDHDLQYAEASRANLDAHGLSELAEVRHASLVPIELDGRTWKYYEPAAFEDLSQIDMLIVDGPPANVQDNARYPAFPLLSEKLSPSAVVLLDDADRPDELEALRLWMERYPQLSIRRLATEKGTAVLCREATQGEALSAAASRE